jgi:hypothetical protein
MFNKDPPAGLLWSVREPLDREVPVKLYERSRFREPGERSFTFVYETEREAREQFSRTLAKTTSNDKCMGPKTHR